MEREGSEEVANINLAKLRRNKEIRWAQRTEVNHIQEGEIIRSIFTLLRLGSIERKESSSLNKTSTLY
jgi:hypothetical protein